MLSARRAALAELEAVRRITRAAYAGYVAELGFSPLPLTEDYGPGIAAGEVWLVSRAGADVALAVLRPEPGALLIYSLAVLPSAQRQGVGRWLLRFAEERARAEGLARLRLYTNARMERNIGLYAEDGYRETGRRPNPRRPGQMFVDMAKAVGTGRAEDA